LLVLEESQRFLDDFEGQTDKARHIQADHAAARVEGAQDQVAEETQRQAGLCQGFRSAGRFGRHTICPVHVASLELLHCHCHPLSFFIMMNRAMHMTTTQICMMRVRPPLERKWPMFQTSAHTIGEPAANNSRTARNNARNPWSLMV